MDYRVELKGNSHHVIGLPSGRYPDTLLILRYPEGDFDTRMKSEEAMLHALYDLFQMEDTLRDGDTFTTEFGRFTCRGVHVVKEGP